MSFFYMFRIQVALANSKRWGFTGFSSALRWCFFDWRSAITKRKIKDLYILTFCAIQSWLLCKMSVLSPLNNADVIKKRLTDFSHPLGLEKLEKGCIFWGWIPVFTFLNFYNFSESETSNQDDNPTQKKRVYRWRKKEPPHFHT